VIVTVLAEWDSSITPQNRTGQGFDAILNERGEDEVEPKRVEMPLKTCRPARMRPKAEWSGWVLGTELATG
jgi:hypothetical protein